MSPRRVLLPLAAAAVTVGVVSLVPAPRARALGPLNPPCIGSPIAPPGCSLGASGGGIVSSASSALTSVTLGAVVAWVVSGARYVLDATAQVLSRTTTPQLTTTWFSATYWRVAGIAALLTVPFLFAAAVQGLVRSDLSLLIRAAFGYLPLALLAVGIAAPLTMLLLAASDQMSAIVSAAAGNEGAGFLTHATGLLSSLAASFESPFVLFLVGLLTVGGALVLWIELLVREAAVYVIVLLLPLAFAAFVWPARRVWAIRSVELLIALILSKFVIVAVLALGGAALGHSVNRSVTGLLAGGVLMALAAFAPWAMVRLIPLAEVASAAAGSLSAGTNSALLRLQQSDARASEGDHWIAKMAQMREAAGDVAAPGPAGDVGAPGPAGDVDARGPGEDGAQLPPTGPGAANAVAEGPMPAEPAGSAPADVPPPTSAEPAGSAAADKPPPADRSAPIHRPGWSTPPARFDIEKSRPPSPPPSDES